MEWGASDLASGFWWATGVEDTFVPQTRPGHRALDEYELMAHYEHWRVDLALAAELGVQALRWGVPWYRVEPRPGAFDWTWTDRALTYLVEDLGIIPIVDLMHYGCPLWLHREFVNDAYPERVASYAAAFARRYAGLVRCYTPLNEPEVNAVMCGRRGRWPPYLRGDRGYLRVLLQLVKGILATVRAIRAVDPRAVMVHVEAAGVIETSDPDLESAAALGRLRRFLSLDLITGRVNRDHPLFPWLLWNGVAPRDLMAIEAGSISLDIMGLNFYPQWSTHELHLNRKGALAVRHSERTGMGFASLIESFHRRYGAPVMITETSALGEDATRAAWLRASVETVKSLRSLGVPVVGYTWFPLFTMIDWRYRTGRRPLEHYRLDLGLYTLNSAQSGPRWRPTPLADLYRRLIQDTDAAVGRVAGGPSSGPGLPPGAPE